MKIALIGLAQSGKTTIFDALTGTRPEESAASEPHRRIIDIPDTRLDKLCAISQPDKKTYLKLEFIDPPPELKTKTHPVPSRTELEILTSPLVREADGLLAVIRSFKNDAVPHPQGNINPKRDLELIMTDLVLNDLTLVSNRVDRIKEEIRRGRKDNEKELAALEKVLPRLEGEKPLRGFELRADEEKLLKGYQLLSAKPILIVENVDEEGIKASAAAGGVRFAGKIELEIESLAPEEQKEFLASFGLAESDCQNLIQEIFQALSLITFYTPVGKETRAWAIPAGSTAIAGAEAIHSDIARGFIKAEVINVDKLLELGSFTEARNKGLLRQEGKEYIVQDGDVITFKFNV